MKIYNFIKKIFALFYPEHCIACGELREESNSPFCISCMEKLKPSRHVRTISACGNDIKCISAFTYEGNIRKAICDFKFEGQRNFADFFAESISECVLQDDGIEEFDYITSVPLSKERLKERGYNQAELVAKRVGKILGLEYLETLNKLRNNKTQHTLSKEERAENVKGVYSVRSGVDFENKKIALCDDIVTTGNTLAECIKILVDAGVAKVICFTTADARCE